MTRKRMTAAERGAKDGARLAKRVRTTVENRIAIASQANKQYFAHLLAGRVTAGDCVDYGQAYFKAFET